ncbi:Programmed cell death protein 2, C-terminal [Dillenia turbinata]|uniref:Programmed cell death protein 2, C-terminal n=1 Tax=Dillenia turbinata TaxID=194707 RepID=A0AAN8UW41_9MAGN
MDSLGEEDESDDDLDLEELSRAFSEAEKLASDSKKENSKQQPEKTDPLTSRSKVSNDKTPVVPCFYIYNQSSVGGINSSSMNNSTVSLKEGQNNLDEHGQEEKWEKENYEYDGALNANRTFLKFKKQMDANPEQRFRYSYGGKPLLSTGDLGEPGQCKLCGESRHFEVQLMPPLLYFLQEVADDCLKQTLETWNWMTLMVYTCSKSCSHAFQRRDFNCHGGIVAEEAVLPQYEKPVSGASQLGYLSA